MNAIEIRRFDDPDQIVDMKARGDLSVLRIADGSTGMHAIVEPEWTWGANETPLLDSPAPCPMRHIGFCTPGQVLLRMTGTGVETHIRRGDYVEISPGHDGCRDDREHVEQSLFAPPYHQH